MKRIKSALNFIVANKIRLNLRSWTVVAWISSDPVYAVSLSSYLFAHYSQRDKYIYMHISHERVQHWSLLYANTWPNSTQLNFYSFSQFYNIFICASGLCMSFEYGWTRTLHLILVLVYFMVYLQVANKLFLSEGNKQKNQFSSFYRFEVEFDFQFSFISFNWVLCFFPHRAAKGQLSSFAIHCVTHS